MCIPRDLTRMDRFCLFGFDLPLTRVVISRIN